MTTVAAMSTVAPQASRRMGRLGPWLAGIWLFFLATPLLEGWRHRDEVGGVLGMIVTVVFAVVYMTIWLTSRDAYGRPLLRPSATGATVYVGALAVLAALDIAFLGEAGVACLVYLAVGCVMVFDVRVAAAIVVALVVLVIGLGAVEGWGSQVGTAFGVLAASVAIFGVRAVMARNLELVAAHEENARLAVDHERTRFARDLHDILGHSLTVITVKAELAGRLMDADPAQVERARAEVADLERLSRDALADVRRAVEGYRELTLPGELARARLALEAAEIEAALPNSTDEVPSELRELFAWTVREGITNVIRHSGARRCEVRLTASSAEVCDDGAGTAYDSAGCTTGNARGASGHGSGLLGLRERAAAAGAVLITRDLSPGFSVKVGLR
ncbi:sensor histidine kinase [soil metagenome]